MAAKPSRRTATTLAVFKPRPRQKRRRCCATAEMGERARGRAADADVLFTMLAIPEAVSATALGADGFLSTMRPASESG